MRGCAADVLEMTCYTMADVDAVAERLLAAFGGGDCAREWACAAVLTCYFSDNPRHWCVAGERMAQGCITVLPEIEINVKSPSVLHRLSECTNCPMVQFPPKRPLKLQSDQ
jgi:hypothetical protein